MRAIPPAALVVFLLSACLGSDFADSVEGSWRLDSGTLDGEAIVLQPSRLVTMNLDGGEISGTAACNDYQGRYRISGERFEIPEGLAVTEMACSPSEVMETERRFLDALLAADTIAFDEGLLTLSGTGADLVFVMMIPEGDVTGDLFGPATLGSWYLVSGTVDGSPFGLVESYPVTLQVNDGSVGGTSACNQYGIQFLDDGSVEVSSTVLGDGFRPEVDGDLLTIWSRGDEGLVYRAGD